MNDVIVRSHALIPLFGVPVKRRCPLTRSAVNVGVVENPEEIHSVFRLRPR